MHTYIKSGSIYFTIDSQLDYASLIATRNLTPIYGILKENNFYKHFIPATVHKWVFIRVPYVAINID